MEVEGAAGGAESGCVGLAVGARGGLAVADLGGGGGEGGGVGWAVVPVGVSGLLREE